jgi:hypothetical protein
VSDLTFRSRSATEIVDGTFRLYREHFVSFLTLSTLLYLPMIAVMIPMLRAMESVGEDPTALGAALIPLSLVAVLAGIFWYPVMWGALMLSASERYLGRDIETGEALRRAFGRFGSLVGSWLLKWLVVFFAFFFFIVPGFYFIARFFAVPATVLLEHHDVGDGLGRSGQLSINQKWRILGTLLLAWAILFGISIAVSMVVTIVVGLAAVRRGDTVDATSSLLLQLPGMFAYILGLPIVVIVETLLYYDVRIRQEGYDIELMSAQLGGRTAEAPAH